MRGDLKWPPPEYKSQAEAENEERRRIAMGPVCRPRRVQKVIKTKVHPKLQPGGTPFCLYKLLEIETPMFEQFKAR